MKDKKKEMEFKRRKMRADREKKGRRRRERSGFSETKQKPENNMQH